MGVLANQIFYSRIGLGLAEVAVNKAKDAINSKLFQSARATWQAAENALDKIGEMLSNAVDLARRQWENARGFADAAIAVIEGDFEKAKAITRQTVDNAQAEYNNFVERQDNDIKTLSLQLKKLGNSTKKALVTAAHGAVEVARNNNLAFMAAQAALDGVDKVENAVYHTLNDFVTAAIGELCDITEITLDGKITAEAGIRSRL